MKLMHTVLLLLTLTAWPAMAEGPSLTVDWAFVQGSRQHAVAIAIKNVTDHEIWIQHPGNRLAVAFVVMDTHGNLLQPEGIAKVGVQDEKVVIKPGKTCEYIDEQRAELARSMGLALPFLTGTGLFAYQLKKGTRYRVTAIYRPYGEHGSGVASTERLFVYE